MDGVEGILDVQFFPKFKWQMGKILLKYEYANNISAVAEPILNKVGLWDQQQP